MMKALFYLEVSASLAAKTRQRALETKGKGTIRKLLSTLFRG